MINYDAPKEIVSKIETISMEELANISEDNKVTVFLDYIQKRKNTISSGVVIETESEIYPCALPDIGCGFRVVKCIGISAEDMLKKTNILKRIDDFLHGKTDVKMIPGLSYFDQMLYEGHKFTASLFPEKRSEIYEENGSYSIPKGHVLNESIYPDDELLNKFNFYQGHFLEIAYTETEKDCIYLFIHCGSFDLATRYMDYYYPLLAKEAYRNKWSSKEEIIQGRFHIPKDAEIAVKYYNDIKCLMNFAVAYRDLVEYHITKIIEEEIGSELRIEPLSDYIHTKLTVGDSVIHQRGIQKLEKSSQRTYIISGEYGIASMLFKTDRNGYFSHGVQADSSIFKDDAADRRLISKIVESEEIEDVIEKTRGVRKCYDYYLSKPGVNLEKYIYPFYSYKIE